MDTAHNKIGALYAFDVSKDGTAALLDPDNMPEAGETIAYRWVHLDLDSSGARPWVEAQSDETVAETLTLEDTRPRFSTLGDGHLLILRGVNLNPAADPEDMVSLRVWVKDKLIISVRRRRLMAVVQLRETLEAGHGPNSIGQFLATLAEGMTSRMTPVVDGLADELDALDEDGAEDRPTLRTALAEKRRSVIALKRYIAPQRDALSMLAQQKSWLVDADDREWLRETVDRITRLVEELDAVRERCGILKDQMADARAEEMNRNTMVLSVIAAVFLPLGFLTGLLGVNIGGIPGTENPYAFALLCLAMLLMGAGITWFFRHIKWI